MRPRLIALGLLLVGCAGAPSQGTASQGTPAVTPATTSALPTQVVTARPSATTAPTAEEDFYIGGTITWTAQTSEPVADTIHTQSVSGTAHVVIHVITPYLMLAERDTGNTYSYDYANNYNCGGSHEEGTLESQAGVGSTDDWDYSIATLNPFGVPGSDLNFSIAMPDYCGASMGGTVDRTVPFFNGFPDCEPTGDQLYARWDGVDSYVLDCDAIVEFNGVDNNIGTATGHVEGTLTTVAAPPK